MVSKVLVCALTIIAAVSCKPVCVIEGNITGMEGDGCQVHPYDALSGNEVTRTHEYTLDGDVITLNTAATDSADSPSYTITELDDKEKSWQKVGTTYTPGSNGSDYKHFKRKG